MATAATVWGYPLCAVNATIVAFGDLAPAENLIRPGSSGVPEVRVRLELLPMAVAELVIATA